MKGVSIQKLKKHTDMDKKTDFATAMKELEEINEWFQQEDIDLDRGLEKLKKGQKLIALSRKRLKDVENEFIRIKADIEKDGGVETVDKEEPAENKTEGDGGIPF